MRMWTFSRRCAKEIVRDPLNLLFGLGFPLVILLLLSAIQANVPVDLFQIEFLSPGIAVFGLSFVTLFSATLVSKDRESALFQRLYTTPLRPVDFILGYMLPMLPLAVMQSAACYLTACMLGLSFTVYTLLAIVAIIPISLVYISLGLLLGSALSVKQVGGVCGGLFTNLTAWLSGIWFDLELLGKVFSKAAKCLPFYHMVECERALLVGNAEGALSHMLPVLGYAVVITLGAVFFFLRQMKRQ